MLNVIKWLFKMLNVKIFKTLDVNALRSTTFDPRHEQQDKGTNFDLTIFI